MNLYAMATVAGTIVGYIILMLWTRANSIYIADTVSTRIETKLDEMLDISRVQTQVSSVIMKTMTLIRDLITTFSDPVGSFLNIDMTEMIQHTIAAATPDPAQQQAMQQQIAAAGGQPDFFTMMQGGMKAEDILMGVVGNLLMSGVQQQMPQQQFQNAPDAVHCSRCGWQGVQAQTTEGQCPVCVEAHKQAQEKAGENDIEVT